MKTLVLAVMSTACAVQPAQTHKFTSERAQCSQTCIAEGRAITASHCIAPNLTSPLSEVPGAWCGQVRMRAAVAREPVLLRGFPFGTEVVRSSIVHDPNWAGWAILLGPATPGESGGGVYGLDGALLAIIVESRDGMTYARIP